MYLIVLAVFLTYIFLSAGFALLTCFLFIYEDTNARGLRGFYDKHGAGPWRVFGRIVPKAMLSQLIIFPTYWIGFLPWMRHPVRPAQEPASTHAPVLLIHGLYHTPAAWLLFIRKLRKNSWDNVYTFRYSCWNTEITTLREQLISEINKIAVESDHQKITLIGHSLGGLLARTVAGDPRCRQKLAAVVTLGAPHQGSKLAAVGFGKLACSLHVASAEMHKIPDFDAPPEAPCLSLFSPVDNMVLPSANLHLDLPGWQEEETAAVSHVFMLYAPDVHKRVLTFLEHVHDSSTI